MTISHWPVHERPREKLLERGASALSDAELLAIFLRTGVKGKTAVDLARELLRTFGSLNALLTAEMTLFTRVHGLGQAKYVQLQAVLEMARRHFAENLEERDVFNSAEQTRQYLVAQLQDFRHEVFACLFLDNRHQLIKYENLFTGTLDAASVYPREIAKKALSHNCAAVIFAHNHPSGNPRPSDADQQLTQQIKAALSLLEIRVLDHFVIGKGIAYSFAENGLL